MSPAYTREILFAVVAGLIAAVAAVRVMMAVGITDAPDAGRKAHAVPTPTSGGVGIAFGLCCGLAAAGTSPDLGWAVGLTQDGIIGLGGVLLLALGMGAIGLIDDLRPMRPALRMVASVIAALTFCIAAAHASRFDFGFGVGANVGPLIGVAGSVLWLIVMINATNFMDGANGLAIGSIGIGLVGLAVVCLLIGAEAIGLLAAVGAAACAGFLVWNFPGGAIFAGDSGSWMMGAFAGALTLVAIADGGMPIWLAPLLFLPLLVDAAATLFWRFSRRRRLGEAHRDHVYQIAIRRGVPVRTVTLAYWGVTAHCAIVAIAAAAFPPRYAPAVALVAFLGHAVIAFLIVRRAHRHHPDIAPADTGTGQTPAAGAPLSREGLQ